MLGNHSLRNHSHLDLDREGHSWYTDVNAGASNVCFHRGSWETFSTSVHFPGILISRELHLCPINSNDYCQSLGKKNIKFVHQSKGKIYISLSLSVDLESRRKSLIATSLFRVQIEKAKQPSNETCFDVLLLLSLRTMYVWIQLFKQAQIKCCIIDGRRR